MVPDRDEVEPEFFGPSCESHGIGAAVADGMIETPNLGIGASSSSGLAGPRVQAPRRLDPP